MINVNVYCKYGDSKKKHKELKCFFCGKKFLNEDVITDVLIDKIDKTKFDIYFHSQDKRLIKKRKMFRKIVHKRCFSLSCEKIRTNHSEVFINMLINNIIYN